MNETNWATQSLNPIVTENDRKALEKAHRYEKKLKRKGYRWYKINNRTQVFVQCDKKGKPTADGQKTIEKIKKIV